jgi:hypothetical protein
MSVLMSSTFHKVYMQYKLLYISYIVTLAANCNILIPHSFAPGSNSGYSRPLQCDSPSLIMSCPIP